MGLDVKVLDANNEEIDLKQTFDDDEDMGFTPVITDDPDFSEPTVADNLDGFGLEDENGDAITDDGNNGDGFDDADDN